MADNKKFKQGGMETVYSDINAEDTRNQQAEELLFQAWDVAGYHGQEGRTIIRERCAKRKRWSALSRRPKQPWKTAATRI